jgi:hypothetical protein
MKVNTQAIHPAIVEGAGGRKGGGWWVDTADRAVGAEAAGGIAAAASDRPEEEVEAAARAAAAEFRPVEDDDEAADVRVRARDGARPLAMVGGSETRGGGRGGVPTSPIWLRLGKLGSAS